MRRTRLAMRRDLLYILLIVFLCACRDADRPRLEVSIEDIQGHCRQAELHPIEEIYNPSDIYAVGDYIVVVNSNKQCNLLYLYNRGDISFHGTFGLYGRANCEYMFADRSPKQNNDSTLFLYTDFACCSEFRFCKGTVKEVDRRRIIDDFSNNVIVLDDSLTLCRALRSDHAFDIYNYRRQKKELSFGDFPISPIRPRTDADRDNICLSVSVYSRERRRLAAFYESLPLIRFFDMDTYECVSETELVDVRKQTASLEEYYDDRNIVYFSRPVATQDRIYVSLINKRADCVPEQTVLLAMDWNGNFTGKYIVDRFCPVYTVSEDGVFYGIAFDGGVSFCRTELFVEQ